jgi:hypothetical protein
MKSNLISFIYVPHFFSFLLSFLLLFLDFPLPLMSTFQYILFYSLGFSIPLIHCALDTLLIGDRPTAWHLHRKFRSLIYTQSRIRVVIVSDDWDWPATATKLAAWEHFEPPTPSWTKRFVPCACRNDATFNCLKLVHRLPAWSDRRPENIT